MGLDQIEGGEMEWMIRLEREIRARPWWSLWAMQRTLDSILHVGEATGGSQVGESCDLISILKP